MKIQIILGSIREGRNGEKVCKWITNIAKKNKETEYEIIDLKEWNLPMFNDSKPPFMGEYSYEHSKKWSEKISEADGYIIVTPEYNHGYPAVLKNAIDYLYKEWNNKPVAFVSYGGYVGGSRAVELLRQVSVELQMTPIREEVNIPFVWQAFDEKGEILNKHLNEKAEGMLKQLNTFAETMKNMRK